MTLMALNGPIERLTRGNRAALKVTLNLLESERQHLSVSGQCDYKGVVLSVHQGEVGRSRAVRREAVLVFMR